MKKCLALLAVLSLFVVPRFAVAEESSALSKTVLTISEKLAAREYQKAFSYVEFLIKLYESDSMPQEAVDISGQTVEFYSRDLLAKKRWQEIADLARRLSGAPLVVQERAKDPIFCATAELTAQEEARNARKRAALAAAKAAEEKSKALAGATAPAAVVTSGSIAGALPQATSLSDLLSYIEEWRADAERRDVDLRASIAAFYAAVIAALLACFAAFCFALSRRTDRAEQRGSATGGVDLDAWTRFGADSNDDIEKICGSFSDEEIRSLLRVCASAGRTIDDHTQRRNNSRDVGRLVYAISRRTGYSHQTASIFSAVGMVRDIGLLSVDATVFGSPQATEEGLAQIRRHVTGTETALLLIDARIRNTLARDIELHHQNMDGSGYAENARGKELPYLARVLRLAESYVSLVSKSNYRPLKNSQEAIEELRGLPTWYDASLLAVLADEV